MKYFEEINSHKYIYLSKLVEPKDNALRIVIEEASVGVTIESESFRNVGCQEIEVTESSHVYEVIFASYIGYSVIDESFALPNDEEVFEGRVFCIYEKSTFLDYLKRTTFACDEHPGPFRHFGFNCLNHIIDIASIDEPAITLLSKN